MGYRIWSFIDKLIHSHPSFHKLLFTSFEEAIALPQAPAATFLALEINKFGSFCSQFLRGQLPPDPRGYVRGSPGNI